MTALLVIGGVVLALFLLLCVPVSVRFQWREGQARGGVYILFFPVLRYPAPQRAAGSGRRAEKSAKRRERKKTRRNAREAKEKENTRTVWETVELIWNLIRCALPGLNSLRRHILFRVAVYASVCGEDAHKTAMAYAGLTAAVQAALAFLSETFSLHRPTVHIAPDFAGLESRYEVSLGVRTRPLFLLRAGGGTLVRYLRYVMEIKKTGKKNQQNSKGGSNHEPAASHQ